jgi:geranylgeranyl diphosphate synthase type II
MTEKTLLKRFECFLGDFIGSSCQRPLQLAEAVEYAVMSGGKRVRPLVAMYSAAACGGTYEDAFPASCAIELLHSYTLVHDDLPAMDNDILRRGKPTVWKKFGQADAILAGDALQALAFRAAGLSKLNRARIFEELADKAFGVVAGQVEDIRRASDTESADIDFIYRHKTADLFVCAAKIGALSAGASKRDVAVCGEFALKLGLAFQLQDDLLDGDSPYGEEETKLLSSRMTSEALSLLSGLSGNVSRLKKLSLRLLGRAF